MGTGAHPAELASVGFFEHRFKGFVVGFLLEQRQAGDRPVEHVEAHAGGADSGASGHGGSLAGAAGLQKELRPLFSPSVPFSPSRHLALVRPTQQLSVERIFRFTDKSPQL